MDITYSFIIVCLYIRELVGKICFACILLTAAMALMPAYMLDNLREGN